MTSIEIGGATAVIAARRYVEWVGKLRGFQGRYRIWIWQYRTICRIDDAVGLILIMCTTHRCEAYRRTQNINRQQ
ncbi:MAG: hypothetical protein OXI16_12110 [Chloroflexota bacterium]|nr:hypothetical protein [Chloroflexota bacterium]